MIEIMKASAGSGKTFNLAKNYIHLLLQKKNQPDAYRHILAVTFTNKATDEMKTRILRELYILSKSPELSGFRKYFVPGPEQMDKPAVCRDDIELKSVAAHCLNVILHDYSAFSVSTIDKFFQKTLKSFAREIGQFASYQIEIDRDSMISESVDRVLDSITPQSKELLEWLTEGAMSDLAEGRKYNMEKRLFETAKRLKHFTHSDLVERFGIKESEAYSKENIKKIEKLCGSVIDDFVKAVRNAAESIISPIVQLGYGSSDFRRYFYDGIDRLRNFNKGDKFEISATVQKCISGEVGLFAASDKYADSKKADMEGLLDKGFERLIALQHSPLEVYNTAFSIVSSLHDLGVAAELYREFDALSKEKNIMSLAESDAVLKDIINGSDTPFIYEKLGVRLENFLLDEFQDTSRIQWDNMWPLLKDSQSHDSYYDSGEETTYPYSLIVGDVKQSIYRWRGSDWQLLDGEVEDEFKKDNATVMQTVLEDNYRSLPSIVEFNNCFFPFMAQKLDNKLEPGRNVISDIYSTTQQNCKSSDSQRGSVDITFAGKEDVLNSVIVAINEVVDNGGVYGNVAILVRTNMQGSRVATYLIEKGIPVVTSDSLAVRSSSVVRRVVANLSLLDNPDDIVARYQVGNLEPVPEYCHSIIDECEFFLRQIEKETPGILALHTLYVQSFLDIVQSYVAENGNNMKGFLEEWAEDKSYISSPEGGNAVRVITIHKAKGLEFPYVIYFHEPSNQELSIRPNEKFWCKPDSAGTELESLSNQIFDVHLTKYSEGTMFRKDYYKELERLFVDIINVAYVAFTRPVKGLHIVTFDSGAENLSSYLKSYVTDSELDFVRLETEDDTERYRFGQLYDFGKESGRKKGEKLLPSMDISPIPSFFCSFAPNAEKTDSGQEVSSIRLRFKTDSFDFFSEDGSIGIDASARRKGVVLHNILSCVEYAEDVESAVADAVRNGDLTENQGIEASNFLMDAIDSVESYGWFSEKAKSVRNEASIIDTDGNVYRPDRVIENDGRIMIIDYKFGTAEKFYRKQVSKYAALYSELGYKNVEAYLWYLGAEGECIDKVV